jgi:hypothetical protein
VGGSISVGMALNRKQMNWTQRRALARTIQRRCANRSIGVDARPSQYASQTWLVSVHK